MDDGRQFQEASQQQRISLVREFVGFFVESKAWWLLPIVIVLAILGGLALFSSSGAAPFIYTLF